MSEVKKEEAERLPDALAAFLCRWGIPKELVFRVGECWFVNLTPHELRLSDGRVVPAAPGEVARLLEAKPVEEVSDMRGDVEFVRTRFERNERGEKLCFGASTVEQLYLVGSIISAQAYGFPVVSPVVTPETRRKPPSERIVFARRWNCFW